MDFEDISPIAAIAGFVGALIGYVMVRRLDDLPMLWRILTPIACFAGGFFYIQLTSD